MTNSTVTVPMQRFAAIFLEEHRIVRDLLLELVDAFEARDVARAGSLIEELVTAAGPHFRYEEWSLYPSLIPIFDSVYAEKLLGDHDFAITSAKRLVELLRGGTLTGAEATEAVELTQRKR